MARSADSRKVVEWRRRLRRYEKTEMTAAAFCEAEGVSTASLYQWRRKLAREATELAEAPSGSAGFTPVRIVASPAMAAHLPGGTKLEIPLGDAAALKVAIAALAAADAQREGGGEAC